MSETLQIGDRVRRVLFPNQYVEVGTVGTVTHQPDGACVMVKWDGLADKDAEGAAYNIPKFVEKITPSTFIRHETNNGFTDSPYLQGVEVKPESIAFDVADDDSVFPVGDAFTVLPTDAAARKAIPLATGVLDYFPAALAEVAKVSKIGSDQHHPGQPLHWERGKSMDQADTLVRHLMERGTVDIDGTRHSAKVAWRALALLQQELEDEGAPVSRGSR